MEDGLSEGLFGLAGVLTGALLHWVSLWWTEHRQRSAHARYLAIRVVCILDKYIEDCLSVVLDDGYCEGRPAGEDGTAEPTVSEPPAPAFPDDLDWKSVDHSLMYRLLAFPRDVEVANRLIAAAAEHDFPPDYANYFEERQYWYAKLGLTAFKTAEEIRKTYRIPIPETDEWSASSRLEQEMEKMEKARTDRREAQKRSIPIESGATTAQSA